MNKLKQWLNKHADEAKLSYTKFEYFLLVTHFKGYMIFALVLYLLSCLLCYVSSFFSDYDNLWLFGIVFLTFAYAAFLVMVFLSKFIKYVNTRRGGVFNDFMPLLCMLAFDIFPILEIIH